MKAIVADQKARITQCILNDRTENIEFAEIFSGGVIPFGNHLNQRGLHDWRNGWYIQLSGRTLSPSWGYTDQGVDLQQIKYRVYCKIWKCLQRAENRCRKPVSWLTFESSNSQTYLLAKNRQMGNVKITNELNVCYSSLSNIGQWIDWIKWSFAKK